MLFFYLQIFIQIVSESLPVSSSGHLILYNCLINKILKQEIIPISEYFLHFLHIPTAIILIIYFFHDIWFYIKNKNNWSRIVYFTFCILLADIITAFGYFVLKIPQYNIPLWISFLITSIILLSLKFIPKKITSKSFSLMSAIILGLIQMISLIPGISRLGAVYTIARWLGLESKIAFAVAWALEWPLLIAAAGKALITHSEIISQLTPEVLTFIGIYSSISYGVLVFCGNLAYREKFWWFGVYMLFPTLVAFIFSC